MDAPNQNINQPKRHHYLPQKYQEGFCRDGSLWLFDRKLGQFRNQTPINTCLERHFYSVEDGEGKKDAELEIVNAKVEGLAWPLIEKLESRQPLSLEERTHFAEFVTLMRFRTPEFERAYNEMSEGLMRRFTKDIFSSVEQTEKILNQEPKEERVTPQEIYEFVQSDEYRINVHRNASLKTMVDLVTELTPEIMALSWMIIHATPETSFVTTDAPFVLLPPRDFKAHGIRGYGLRTLGTLKVFPLSQKACLIMGDVIKNKMGFLISHQDAGVGKVKEINLALTSRCERFLLGRDEALVRSLTARSGIDKSQPGPKTNLPFAGANPS
jgi:hypothetical protein